MNWYYKHRGTHVYVRVFMNGAKCGNLVFSNDEFEEVKLQFINNFVCFLLED